MDQEIFRNARRRCKVNIRTARVKEGRLEQSQVSQRSEVRAVKYGL